MPVMDDEKITQIAKRYVRKYGTTDPESLAHLLGIRIIETNFATLKGVDKVIKRNAFIFIKTDAY